MSYRPPYTTPEILQMTSEGRTPSQIAHHFGISASRVSQLIRGAKREKLSAERSAAIRHEIGISNDIGRKLPIDDLLCVLNLPKRPETVLRAYLNKQGITDFSLRDTMDFLIPIVENARDHYDHMPAYRVKMLGQILYASMIRALSAVDCGEAYHVEWSARTRRLREYLVGTGGFYPYVLHGPGAPLL